MTARVVTPGLAPSASLAPSATLAPATTIYAGGPIAPHQFSMGIGTNGALVDVSAYVEYGEGVSYTYGRTTQFDDVSPGTFTFTLNNSDGRFTPENPLSPLGTTVAEGMSVVWLLGTRLTAGKILTVEIPSDEATWHQLVVTCDDMLGTAGRHSITSIADGLYMNAAGDLMWALDEEEGSVSGMEQHGDGLGAFNLYRSNQSSTTQTPTFGVQQVVGLPGTAVTVTAAAGETNWFGTRHGNTMITTNLVYKALGTPSVAQAVSLGFWNMWVYPQSTINLAVVPKFATDYAGYSWSAQIQCTPTTVALKMGSAALLTSPLTAAQQLVPHYVEMQLKEVWQTASGYWAMFGYLFVDGVYVGSQAWYDPQHSYTIPQYTNSVAPVEVSLAVTTPAGASTPNQGTVQRVSHTTNGGGLEYNALLSTLEGRRAVLDTLASDINSATYNGPLSASPIGFPDVNDATVLDIYNDIVRSESGHMFTQTSGSLLAAAQYIQIRARDRPPTPKAVFDVSAEGSGLPSFVRDITNVAAQVEVQGPLNSVTVADPTVTGRYITSGVNETVLYARDGALREWGQDRLYRGRNRAVRAQTFTVDAASTPIDRSGDLLSLVPGDRIQITNLPTTRLGFNTWDGWLLGATETHGTITNQFTFNLAPTIPISAVYDTDLFGSGGDVTLVTAAAVSDTTIGVVIASGAAMSTVVPYTVQVDSEQMLVTAVSGTLLTVTRGQSGTTAVSHATGAPVEVLPTAMFAY